MRLVGAEVFKGFRLNQDFSLEGRVLVITGKNGCGKTRFMESVVRNCTHIYEGDRRLPSGYASYLKSNEFVPDFSSAQRNYSKEEAENAARLLDAYKHYLGRRPNPNVPPVIRIGDVQDGIDIGRAATIYGSISKSLQKPIDQLTSDDVRVGYISVPSPRLGAVDVVSAFIQLNDLGDRYDYRGYLAYKGQAPELVVSKENLIDAFGGDPIASLNEIINQVLGDRYEFRVIKGGGGERQARLYNKAENVVIDVEALSSGETTLVWLCMVLYATKLKGGIQRDDPKLLLLDEPDAALHPEMVKRMYEVLQSYAESQDVIVVLTTHSPTTVALGPANSLFLIEDGVVKKAAMDEALSDLLHGVNQVSIDFHNRRQVFVESFRDQKIYSRIYDRLVRVRYFDSQMSLEFMPASLKLEDEHVRDMVRKYFNIVEGEAVDGFILGLGGSSDCGRVTAHVKQLAGAGNNTVRGVVDWDLKNRSDTNVIVHAEGNAYTIENVMLDPVVVIRKLVSLGAFDLPSFEQVGHKLSEWQSSDELIQQAVDTFIGKVLGRKSNSDFLWCYASGRSIQSDKEFLQMSGKDLQNLILSAYSPLNKCRPLLDELLSCMLIDMDGEFIPMSFVDLFKKLR